jgi:hypothetical protein
MATDIDFDEVLASLAQEREVVQRADGDAFPIVYMQMFDDVWLTHDCDKTITFEHTLPNRPTAYSIEVEGESGHPYLDKEKEIKMYWNDVLCESSKIVIGLNSNRTVV